VDGGDRVGRFRWILPKRIRHNFARLFSTSSIFPSGVPAHSAMQGPNKVYQFGHIAHGRHTSFCICFIIFLTVSDVQRQGRVLTDRTGTQIPIPMYRCDFRQQVNRPLDEHTNEQTVEDEDVGSERPSGECRKHAPGVVCTVM
jgi:hypothetical protein